MKGTATAVVAQSTDNHVRVSPPVLNFPPPLNRVIAAVLTLENITGEYISYKVKTTAPKRYVVRPNIGIIPPKENVEIQVMLHMSKDPPDGTAAKDRFQVQTILLDDKTSDQRPAQYSLAELRSLWANFSKPEEIKKLKLKCTFLDGPDGGPASSPAATGPRTPIGDTHTPMSSSRHAPSPNVDATAAMNAFQQLQMENRRLKTSEQKLQAKIASLSHDLQQAKSGGLAPVVKKSPFNVVTLVLCLLFLLLGYYLG
mmetsp:Transcript_7465/g.31621  ORF Transcript_7465/g.31621 Transcript_7465/m.31621 type:complete len:256 (-) Transcript_7465:90-857(-)